jgi:hypothetical protein
LIYVSIFALHFVLHSFVLPPLLLQIILWLPRLVPIVSTKSTDSNICYPLAEKLLKWIGLRSSPGLKVEVSFALYAYERNVRYLWAVVLEEESFHGRLLHIFSTCMIEMLCHNAGVSLPFTFLLRRSVVKEKQTQRNAKRLAVSCASPVSERHCRDAVKESFQSLDIGSLHRAPLSQSGRSFPLLRR